MNLLRINLIIVAIGIIALSCSKEEVVIAEGAQLSIDLGLANETDWNMANEILEIVNDHRTSIGLTAIRSDRQHASAHAVMHTKYMIDVQQINHDNFGERSKALRDRGAVSVGENVAFGYRSATAVVHAWLNSPSHRTMIEGNYTHSGFGVMTDPDGVYYFTQLFYRR